MMGTWKTSIVAVAIFLQVASAAPSFGTGDQLEDWNEVDNEFPGQYISKDYIMPMRPPYETEDNGNPPVTENDLSAPSPTPRPPTENDLDTISHPSLTPKPSSEKTLSGAGDLKSNEILKNPNQFFKSSTLNQDKINPTVSPVVSTKKGETLDEPNSFKPPTPVLSILSDAKGGDSLESISNLISNMINSMDFSEDKTQLKTSANAKRSSEVLGGNMDLPKLIESIMTSQLTPIGKDITMPCGEDESGSNESSSDDQNPKIKALLHFPDQPSTKPPTIKGIILKSLIPREYFLMKDIHELMKARAANSKDGSKTLRTEVSSRYIVLPPKREAPKQASHIVMKFPISSPMRNFDALDIGSQESSSQEEFPPPFMNDLSSKRANMKQLIIKSLFTPDYLKGKDFQNIMNSKPNLDSNSDEQLFGSITSQSEIVSSKSPLSFYPFDSSKPAKIHIRIPNPLSSEKDPLFNLLGMQLSSNNNNVETLSDTFSPNIQSNITPFSSSESSKMLALLLPESHITPIMSQLSAPDVIAKPMISRDFDTVLSMLLKQNIFPNSRTVTTTSNHNNVQDVRDVFMRSPLSDDTSDLDYFKLPTLEHVMGTGQRPMFNPYLHR